MNSITMALKNMKRSIAMTLASIILVFLTVLIVGVICLISANTIYASNNAINNLTLYVLANPNASEAEIAQLGEDIKANVNTTEISLTTKENALNQYANELYKNNPQQLLDLFGGNNNPLSDEYKIKLADGSEIENAANIIKNLANVKYVGYGDSQATQNFVNVMHKINFFSVIFAIIMMVISIFIITNTIKLTISARYKEIEIMRLVGATKNYVRMPFIWEGILFGIIGAGFACLCLIGLYNVFIKMLSGQYGDTSSLFLPLKTIVLPLVLGLSSFGILIGASGSLISTWRYLKK